MTNQRPTEQKTVQTQRTSSPSATGVSTANHENGDSQSVPDGHKIDDRYNFHDASFRRHYQLNYSDGAHDYESYYAPAYRFGYELAEEHEGADWASVKNEAQHHWQMKHGSAWQNVATAVHYGWREQRDPDALRVQHHGEYADYRKSFMAHYADAHGEGGGSFEQYEPAYQRGYDLAIDPAYRTHLWTEMEPELRQYYEEEYADGSVSWEHYRSAAQYAWHDVRAMGV